MKTAFLIISLWAMLLTGCVSHPFLQADSRSAITKVAMPYIVHDCKSIEIYAGYTFDWSVVAGNDSIDPEHGFGGILGGCGKYAKIVCVVDDPCTVHDCKKTVLCQVIQVLQEAP